MATRLRQSTAVDVKIGPFMDSGDGITPETTLTLTQPDILLSKVGGALAQKSAAQTLSHDAGGWYTCNLSTTDTNTLGRLLMSVQKSGAVPIWHEFEVVPASIFDGVYTAKLWMFDDDAAGTPTDRYAVCWFKNGAPVPAAAITTPLLRVYKVADGSDLVASVAMSEVGTEEDFRKDCVTTERTVAGVAYIALATATIDGVARTWKQPVGRDSNA